MTAAGTALPNIAAELRVRLQQGQSAPDIADLVEGVVGHGDARFVILAIGARVGQGHSFATHTSHASHACFHNELVRGSGRQKGGLASAVGQEGEGGGGG